MGISSFYGLQTSLRGLQAMQRSIDTTGHNISNASTVGYSRQEAALSASSALNIPAGGTLLAHLLATGKHHDISRPFDLDRYVTGRLIDEAAGSGIAQ